MIRDPPATDALRSLRRSAHLPRTTMALAVATGARSLKRRAVDRLRYGLSTLSDGFSLRDSTPSDADSAPTARSPLPNPTTRAEILDCGFTPAEYVRRVLREHGGRIRQRQFVDEYGWTPATASRLLMELEDDGRVVRYRRGREKVVCLPEAVPGTDAERRE